MAYYADLERFLRQCAEGFREKLEINEANTLTVSADAIAALSRDLEEANNAVAALSNDLEVKLAYIGKLEPEVMMASSLKREVLELVENLSAAYPPGTACISVPCDVIAEADALALRLSSAVSKEMDT